jgi:hypothetical protein
VTTSSKVGAKTAKRPPNAGKGRPPGTPNKATKQLKDMILGALDQAGGEAYLLECARDPKLAPSFMTLVGKVLPTTLQGAGPNGEHVFQRIVREVVDVKPNE